MPEANQEITRWIDTDDLTKLAILDRAAELRKQNMAWQKIAAQIGHEFSIRVSWQCLWFRLTPAGMEKKRENTRRYRLTYPDRVKQQAAEYRKQHPELVKEQAAKYRKSHPDKMREYAAKYRMRYPERVKQSAAKHREKKRRQKQEEGKT